MGLMSAQDKNKLDNIAAGAQVNAVTTVAGRTGAVTLTKTDVGLSNVDNVSAASLRDRATHTGEQTIDTVTGLQEALDMRSPTGMFKNKLVNGGFQVWQGGSGSSDPGYSACDQWAMFSEGSGQSTAVSLHEMNLNMGSPLNGRVLGVNMSGVSSANNAAAGIRTFIENVKTLHDRYITVSFECWSNLVSREISIEFGQFFGTGGSSPVRKLGIKKFQITTELTRYSHTFEVPSVLGKVLGTGSNYLGLFIYTNSGSDYNDYTNNLGIQPTGPLYFRNVQVEAGEIATPFEERPHTIEQFLCGRYYEIVHIPNLYDFYASGVQVYDITNVNFQTIKRVTPTIWVSGSIASQENVYNFEAALPSIRGVQMRLRSQASGRSYISYNVGTYLIADSRM